MIKSWDKYFLDVCNIISTNSKCFSRKVGAIIVRDKSIISTGYNGPPRNVPDCYKRFRNQLDVSLCAELTKKYGDDFINLEQDICPRRLLEFKSGEGLQYCVAGHGERNAIVNAARIGIPTKGTIMYMNCAIPCTPCLVEIINAGISEIVVTEKSYYDVSADYLIKESRLKVRTYES